MKKSNVSNETQKTYETNRKIRGDWGAINPVTKVIPDKRRKPPKHKGREFED